MSLRHDSSGGIGFSRIKKAEEMMLNGRFRGCSEVDVTENRFIHNIVLKFHNACMCNEMGFCRQR
jgi:hypothetical protein